MNGHRYVSRTPYRGFRILCNEWSCEGTWGVHGILVLKVVSRHSSYSLQLWNTAGFWTQAGVGETCWSGTDGSFAVEN